MGAETDKVVRDRRKGSAGVVLGHARSASLHTDYRRSDGVQPARQINKKWSSRTAEAAKRRGLREEWCNLKRRTGLAEDDCRYHPGGGGVQRVKGTEAEISVRDALLT